MRGGNIKSLFGIGTQKISEHLVDIILVKNHVTIDLLFVAKSHSEMSGFFYDICHLKSKRKHLNLLVKPGGY